MQLDWSTWFLLRLYHTRGLRAGSKKWIWTVKTIPSQKSLRTILWQVFLEKILDNALEAQASFS